MQTHAYFKPLSETDMLAVNGGSTKVVGTIAGLVCGVAGLGSVIASSAGASSVAMGFSAAASLSGSVAVWCLLVPAP